MFNRRTFFKKLASGIFVSASAQIFIPELIKTSWKIPRENYQVRLVKGFLKNSEAFASYIGPVIKQVLDCAGDYPKFNLEYKQEENLSFPLDCGVFPKDREGCIIL